MEQDTLDTIREAVLTSERVVAYCQISEQFLTHTDFKLQTGWLANQMVTALFETYVLCDRIEQEFIHHEPKNWFQHLKKDILPGFVLNRWPVKEKEIKFKITRRYKYPFINAPGGQNYNYFIDDTWTKE